MLYWKHWILDVDPDIKFRYLVLLCNAGSAECGGAAFSACTLCIRICFLASGMFMRSVGDRSCMNLTLTLTLKIVCLIANSIGNCH